MGIEKRSLNSVFTPLFTTRRQRHSAAAHYDSIRTYILLLLDTHIFLTRIQTASSQQELASRRKLARPRIASTGRSWPSKEKPRAASMSRYSLLDSTPASLHRCTWYTETHTRGTLHRLYFIRYLSLSLAVCVCTYKRRRRRDHVDGRTERGFAIWPTYAAKRASRDWAARGCELRRCRLLPSAATPERTSAMPPTPSPNRPASAGCAIGFGSPSAPYNACIYTMPVMWRRKESGAFFTSMYTLRSEWLEDGAGSLLILSIGKCAMGIIGRNVC